MISKKMALTAKVKEREREDMWKSILVLPMFTSSIVLIIKIDHYNHPIDSGHSYHHCDVFSFDPFLTWVGSLNRSDITPRNARFFVTSFALCHYKCFDKTSSTYLYAYINNMIPNDAKIILKGRIHFSSYFQFFTLFCKTK